MPSVSTQVDARAELLATFKQDRALAHRVIFTHRHPNTSPVFHDELIDDWASPDVGVLQMVFRGGAKSTLAEEGLLLGAAFGEFKYGLIVAYNMDKACQRLHSIRHEAETNQALSRLFGNLQGAIWSVDQLLFANGVMIQALGKGMSLRGVKHLDMRPDYLLGDDLEDRVDVRNEERMNATWQWFNFDLLPALAQGEYRARVLATPMHPDALPMRLEREGEFRVRKVPIYYLDEMGERRSSWDDRYPLTMAESERRADETRRLIKSGALPRDTQIPRKQDSIEHIEDRAHRGGHFRDFQCEYLVTAESQEEKPFKREMIRVVPQFCAWQGVNMMFDPARTTNVRTSARTGYAAWSDIGNKCVVWESWGKFLKPDEIIEAIFQAGGCEPSEGYERMCGPFGSVIHIGVEEDGLNEWLLQPIREQQARRGVLLPIKAMRAPKGKLDFIRSLQPYFNAREIEFAQPMDDLEQELLSFPHASRRDVANALAYRTLMRKGRPIFGDFTAEHVREGLTPSTDDPLWLAINAAGAITCAALCQFVGPALRIHADWAREGEIPEEAEIIATEARRIAGKARLHFVAPPIHFDRYNNVGLAAAIKPDWLQKGADPMAYAKGRSELRDLLQRNIRGMPGLLVSDKAKWATGALAGGYAHVELKHGALADYAEEGPYRILMEAVESLAGMGAHRSTDAGEKHTNAVTPGGVPYKSMLGATGGRTLRRG